MTRILLAALLGGFAMFVWNWLAHEVLPLGEAGVHEIPNEAVVLGVMQNNIREAAGFYIFPGFGLGPSPTRAEQNEAMKHMDEKLARNPSGILIYHPAGARPMNIVRLLSVEFVTELLQAFLAVVLLTQTNLTSYGARVGFVAIVGVLVALSTNVSYWNWFGFPKNYTLAYMFIEFVGFVLVGLIAGWILKKAPAPMRA